MGTMDYDNNTANIIEEDGSVYTEDKGIRQIIKAGELVRPCGAIEISTCKGASYKLHNTVMPIWLQSKHKLKTDDIFEALKIVTRQVPQLQFCVARHNYQFWFKRMDKLKIDFEITTENEMDVLHEMLDTSFDIWKGPLWKVKYIESKYNDANRNYSSILFLIIQHSINDGVTNMKIAREFVLIMNKLSSGEKPVATLSPVIPTIDNYARNETTISYMVKKVVSKAYSTLFTSFNDEVYFSGRIPRPKSNISLTKVLIDHFSIDETTQIVRMCKEENITINSFISNVANFSLLAVAQSKSATPLETKKILVAHSVNHRRHFEPRLSDVPGCHVSMFEDEMIASLSDAEDFWSICRTNQLNFKQSLDVERDHLKVIPIYNCADIYFPINYYLSSYGFKCKTVVYYSLSNMGNLDKLLPTSPDDNIVITDLIRSVSAQFLGSPFTLYFQTFRGRLTLSMDYYTNYMTEEIALEFFTKFYKHVRNLIKTHRLLINN